MSEGEVRIVLQPVGGLLLLPLQGEIHRDLLIELGNTLLGYLQEHGARGVIFDMAGIEILDHYDFDGLRQVVESATLMGAPVVLAGIRPGVAAGLTTLGVDDSWVRAARTVEQAMALLR